MKFKTFIKLNNKDGPVVIRVGSIDAMVATKNGSASNPKIIARIYLKGPSGHTIFCDESVEEVMEMMVDGD